MLGQGADAALEFTHLGQHSFEHLCQFPDFSVEGLIVFLQVVASFYQCRNRLFHFIKVYFCTGNHADISRQYLLQSL